MSSSSPTRRRKTPRWLGPPLVLVTREFDESEICAAPRGQAACLGRVEVDLHLGARRDVDRRVARHRERAEAVDRAAEGHGAVAAQAEPAGGGVPGTPFACRSAGPARRSGRCRCWSGRHPGSPAAAPAAAGSRRSPVSGRAVEVLVVLGVAIRSGPGRRRRSPGRRASRCCSAMMSPLVALLALISAFESIVRPSCDLTVASLKICWPPPDSATTSIRRVTPFESPTATISIPPSVGATV